MSKLLVDYYLDSDPERYHSRDSPYFGLTIAEQRALAIVRRPKGRTPRGITRRLRKADKNDYQKLVLACSEALIFGSDNLADIRMDRISLDIELIYNFRRYFSKTFPRVVPVAYKDWSVVVRFRVDKLLKWLHSEGHCLYTPQELRKQLWAMSQEVDKINFYHDVAADISLVELYSEIIGDAESGKIKPRTNKGRRKYRKKSLTNQVTCDTLQDGRPACPVSTIPNSKEQ